MNDLTRLDAATLGARTRELNETLSTGTERLGAAMTDRMLEMTHTDRAPWTIGLGNDKRRLKLDVIRHVLSRFDYPNKDRKAIGEIDEKVLGRGPGFVLGR